MPDSRALPDFKGLLLFIPALIPLLPLHTSSGLLITWTILSLIYFLLFPAQRIRFPKIILLPIAVFFLFVLTLPFANDVSNQSKYIERNIAWLVIPLAFWLTGIHQQKQWMKIIFYFTFGYTLLMLYGHLITIAQLYSFRNINVTSLTFFYRTTFENTSGLHPAYATLFSGLCILYCTYILMKQRSTMKIIFIILIAVLHLSSTVLLASRMALVATLVSLLILIFSKKEFIKFGLLMLSALTITGVFFTMNTPFISSRMQEVSKEALQMPAPKTGNTLSIRKGIYTCDLILLKTHWLFGLTPGDLQANLNNCYGNIKAKDLQAEEYNTHNEYLNKWLSFGLAGICLLLALLFIPFIKAMKSDFVIYACFLVLMSIVLFSENMFSRQYGLFFFMIFYSSGLVVTYSEKQEAVKTINN